MAKFRKVSTCQGIVVFVGDDFYKKMCCQIRGNISGIANTRMYLYWLDGDGVMWRHPTSMDWYSAKSAGRVERVIAQSSFDPEAYFL